MCYDFDNKNVVINDREYPLDPEVWKIILFLSKEKEMACEAIDNAVVSLGQEDANKLETVRSVQSNLANVLNKLNWEDIQ